MSYLEFFGTLAGLAAIALSAKASIWNWPVGIFNTVLFFFLFYQVQLYPDMFLYAFFFVTNIVGWWRWAHPGEGEEDRKKELRVSHIRPMQLFLIAGIGISGTLAMGTFASKLHELLPYVFQLPSAFPYLDSFVTVMSITATYFVIQKKIEVWIIWIVVDLIATYIYFAKGIKFVSLQYLVFCFLAAYGWYNWRREFRSYQKQS